MPRGRLILRKDMPMIAFRAAKPMAQKLGSVTMQMSCACYRVNIGWPPPRAQHAI
jgi:hypothetical protein